MKINPVILVGGTGTRLWPMSRSNFPKQFNKFDGEYSLFQQTLLRIKEINNINRIYLVVNESNYFLCLDQLHELKIENAVMVVEPDSRNTAPAIAAAALIVQQHNTSDELMLVLASDHKIKNAAQFAETIHQGAESANDKIILFGVKPTGPATAYGYIQAECDASTPVKVKTFYEKPNLENAKQLIAQENCYWNSGLFLFSVETILKEFSSHAPDIDQLASQASNNAIQRDNTYYLNRDAFSKMPNIPIDIAIMEKTHSAYVLALKSDWSDLGDWNAIYSNAQADAQGNVAVGNVLSLSTTHSYLQSNDKLLTTVGLDNIVVVVSKDSVLVADKNQTQSIKALVDLLKQNHADYVTHDIKVHRPWGTYESVMRTENFQVKHIMVKPGGILSLQLHHHRSEHWIVVKGIANVVCGSESFEVHENESTYIPINTKHRLINLQDTPLELIEVQVGDYLGEDDIVRLEDVYGRTKEHETIA